MLADAAQALAGGVRELLDRNVDELTGQLGDEPLELELLLECLLPVGRALFGRVRHRGQHEGAFGRPQRAHPDLDRRLRVVLVAGDDLEGGADRVGVRPPPDASCGAACTADGVRREHVEKPVAPVAELSLRLTVDQHDRALRIQDRGTPPSPTRGASRVPPAAYFVLLTAVSFTSSDAKSSTTNAPFFRTIFAAGASVPAPLPFASTSMSTTAKS